LSEIEGELKAKGIKVTLLKEDDYPEELRHIYDPPPVLYWQGSRLPGEGLKIALVGTRKATPYGLRVALQLACELAEAGVGVVSGLARGIDSAAHRGALKAGGLTWAVLGCGVDVVYPPENRQLYQEIKEKGAVISEFPPGTPPHPGHFPARNRIISGLCQGVVVVEAPSRSGALITADMALEQNRDVFAVPGPITSRASRGCLELIQQGAKMVTCTGDILSEYGFVIPDRSPSGGETRPPLLPGEEAVWPFLGDVPVHLDFLLSRTGMSPGDLGRLLVQMELRGLVKRLPGGFYQRV